MLRDAVALYRGELLATCYQDWCLLERERLHNMHLICLDKLMDYCAASGEYEAALDYGARSLTYEEAREATHRRLMRLHYLAGDRTAALRQYERCVSLLQRELVFSQRTAPWCSITRFAAGLRLPLFRRPTYLTA